MTYSAEVMAQIAGDLSHAMVDPVVESVGMVVEPLLIKIICIFGGPLWSLMLMCLGYLLFDWMTPFNTGKELKNGNRAVGQVISGMLIAVAICVGIPLGFSLF